MRAIRRLTLEEIDRIDQSIPAGTALKIAKYEFARKIEEALAALAEQEPEPVACSQTFSCRCPKHYSPEPEPVAISPWWASRQAQALDALNRMQSILMMSDGRHPRDVLRGFIQLASKPARRKCWCATCDEAENLCRTRMSLCPNCGDKRCPRAEFHGNECREAGGKA